MNFPDLNSWFWSFVGGTLIGLSATLLLVVHGRIAGISGILGLALSPGTLPAERSWRLYFLLGLIGIGGLAFLLSPSAFRPSETGTPLILLVAGLAVGYGTRVGSGCTSGHGVCGLSRFSVRSLAATLTFIVTGALTVLMARTLGLFS